jgi:hypothetical protein
VSANVEVIRLSCYGLGKVDPLAGEGGKCRDRIEVDVEMTLR